MKTIKKVSLLLLFLGSFISCSEGKKEQQKSGIAQGEMIISVAQEQNAVKAVVELLRGVIIEPDEILLSNLTSDELTYGHSSGVIQDKDKFIDDLVHGAFDFTEVDFTDQRIVVSGSTAIVRHIFEAKATNAGEPVDIRIGNVLVYVKQEGEWKLLARQAYKL
ncbi:nuclear transport factor 2 family protein [Sinomicrobium sp. M5D2P17]